MNISYYFLYAIQLQGTCLDLVHQALQADESLPKPSHLLTRPKLTKKEAQDFQASYQIIQDEELQSMQRSLEAVYQQAVALKEELDLVKLRQEVNGGLNEVEICDEEELARYEREHPGELNEGEYNSDEALFK